MGWTVSAKDQEQIVARRYSAIKRAAAHPQGSSRRAEEIAFAAEELGVGRKTISRWLDQYEKQGLEGLANKQPRNAGSPRVHVSFRFDQAVRALGFGLEELAEIGTEADQSIKDILASRAEAAGVMDVKRRAEFELLKICESRGMELPEEALSISRRHIERFAEFRQVNLMRNDRKKFEDGAPRIMRDWTGVSPLAMVIADVKYVDVRLLREDGTAAYPKLICFKDGGTDRVYCKLLLLPAGRNVRQEDVIQAFIEMSQDPFWGFPEGIYMDNGREFSCLEMLREAFSAMRGQAGREIIKARPYNAAAKTVESAFSGLDRYLFSSLHGYAGAERMRKKTQNVGKEPDAFPGTWFEFQEIVGGLLRDFNSRPGGEQWPDESPNAVFARKAGDGWRPTHVDGLVLDSSFCRLGETRRIDRGTISIGDVRHHHPELDTLPHRTELEIALPWRTGADPLAKMPDGRWICVRPDRRFPALSPEGIRESAARQGRYRRSAAKLAKQVRPYDPTAATLEMVARQPQMDAPGWGRELKGDEDLAGRAQAQIDAAAERAAEPKMAEVRARRDANESRQIDRRVNVAHQFQR